MHRAPSWWCCHVPLLLSNGLQCGLGSPPQRDVAKIKKSTIGTISTITATIVFVLSRRFDRHNMKCSGGAHSCAAESTSLVCSRLCLDSGGHDGAEGAYKSRWQGR